MFLQHRCRVLIFLILFSWHHRVETIWKTAWLILRLRFWSILSSKSWWLNLLDWGWGKLSEHFFNCANHQISIKLAKINVFLQYKSVLIETLWGFHASDIHCTLRWRTRSTRGINLVINHKRTSITLRITIRRDNLGTLGLACLLDQFLSAENKFKRVNILTLYGKFDVVTWASQTWFKKWLLHAGVLLLKFLDTNFNKFKYIIKMFVIKPLTLSCIATSQSFSGFMVYSKCCRQTHCHQHSKESLIILISRLLPLFAREWSELILLLI